MVDFFLLNYLISRPYRFILTLPNNLPVKSTEGSSFHGITAEIAHNIAFKGQLYIRRWPTVNSEGWNFDYFRGKII